MEILSFSGIFDKMHSFPSHVKTAISQHPDKISRIFFHVDFRLEFRFAEKISVLDKNKKFYMCFEGFYLKIIGEIIFFCDV